MVLTTVLVNQPQFTAHFFELNMCLMLLSLESCLLRSMPSWWGHWLCRAYSFNSCSWCFWKLDRRAFSRHDGAGDTDVGLDPAEEVRVAAVDIVILVWFGRLGFVES